MNTPSSIVAPTPVPLAIPAVPIAHDRKAVDEACARMDRLRNDLRAKLGEMSLTSELLREAREP